ncbi:MULTISPECIES: rhomboid family intramembrane serine protease [unclassified Roseitalea]|uniref:rhomboid family intramembrane serine protease n=1 Tax=unclassified Roseitalea TaxID=2639107 RepID=UPI00273F4B03|nr:MULTISPECIES: rhomboid family intramembrane serine protease [unclassified Roseitalea]
MSAPERKQDPRGQGPEGRGGMPAGAPRQPAFNLHGAIVVLVAICVGVHVLRTVILDGAIDRWLIVNFAFFPIRYAPGFFVPDLPTLVSPVTHTFLHGDWVHLGFNMIWLVVFGAPVAWRLGWVGTFAFWIVTALGAVVLHTAIYFGDMVPLLGASGAVSGFLGAAARFGFKADRRNPRHGFAAPLMGPLASLRQRGVVPFLLIWMALNFATGMDLFGLAGGASIAWEAHIGGLLTGFFAIGLIDRGPRA